jgi:NhaP-type Na+/H+ or K+/H+ antiporter
MAKRMAGVLSIVVFAFCLLLGLRAGNPFNTIVSRALVGMAGTYVVGLVIGAVAQRMVDESVRDEERKIKNPGGSAAASDR